MLSFRSKKYIAQCYRQANLLVIEHVCDISEIRRECKICFDLRFEFNWAVV